jgi:hypothetical protein
MLSAKILSYHSRRLLTQLPQQQQGARPPSSSLLPTATATALLSLPLCTLPGTAACLGTHAAAGDVLLTCLCGVLVVVAVLQHRDA